MKKKGSFWRTFIQISTIGFSLLAVYFLTKGSWLSADDIAFLHLGKTYLPNISSTTQRVTDTNIGAILMFLSFIFQTINLCWSMRWDDFATNKYGLTMAIVFILIIGYLFNWAGDNFEKGLYNNVVSIIKTTKNKSVN